ncbi:MAG: pyridoxal-phosphate dependent enzyme [Thermodesulfobacteriota bacterium]|nr:pyridoxal-phosphate dependent enzyme [Thermodesulfobacteriota bacterium]
MPIEAEYFPSIPVGHTPLWEPENFRKQFGFKQLTIKDDGANPTSSFKERASYLVSALAKKIQIQNIALASTGNGLKESEAAQLGIKMLETFITSVDDIL